MTTDLDSIKKCLVGISRGDTILDMLMEFERTLDNAEIFAYKNWIFGELVEGPHIGRYFFKVVFMYPAKKMPDPNGGLRLTKLGAKVNFRKGVFKRPEKVKGPENWVDPQTKRAKMLESDIWLVTIELPMKYINRGLEQTDDVIQKDIEKTNAELADAFEQDSMTDEGEVPTDMMQPEEAPPGEAAGLPPEEEV
jgi:hypothetical protein